MYHYLVFEIGFNYSILEPFALLHFQHKVCRLSSVVIPFFDIGIIWSISKRRLGYFSIEFPHLQQV